MAFNKFLSILGASVLIATPVTIVGCGSIKTLSSIGENNSIINIEWDKKTDRWQNAVNYLVENLDIDAKYQVSLYKTDDWYTTTWVHNTYNAKEKNLYVVRNVENWVTLNDNTYDNSYFIVEEYLPNDNYVEINWSVQIWDNLSRGEFNI